MTPAASSHPPQDHQQVGLAKRLAKGLFDFLSGFGLATTLLLLLGVLTWFGTLEQVERGLFLTSKKYFDPSAFWLVPELNGRRLPLVLPGVYWVSALLFVNLLLGGVVRMRKGWKNIGVLIAHLGILFLLLGGFVTERWEQRGNMAIGEGETGDVAEHYFDYVIELTEVRDGKPVEPVHVVGEQYLADLHPYDRRVLRLANLPFDLEVTGYQPNAEPRAITELAPANGEHAVNGYYLFAKEPELQAEANLAGTYARVLEKDGKAGAPFILAAASYHPYTLHHGDKTYLVSMRKRLWQMPFSITLDKFTAEFHPGTMRPSKFVSAVTRHEGGVDSHVVIQMNEPMRHKGLTFFQASWGPQDAKPGEPLFSVFEVVRNPADRWPWYAMYIVGIGLFVHFVIKLDGFLTRSPRKPNVPS